MVKIYLDGADLNTMADCPYVDGYTTNPSLCRKAGVTDYKTFGKSIAALALGKPVSIEVLADDFDTMESQAREIASWGENVFVKVPVTRTDGQTCGPLIAALARDGIQVNVTAIMTMEQVRSTARYLYAETPAILSIFSGRIADTGRDPVPFITAANQCKHDKTEILWASTREVYNVKQAEQAGADIITMTPDLIKKMELFGKDLAEYSRETVQMFYNDAKGITL